MEIRRCEKYGCPRARFHAPNIEKLQRERLGGTAQNYLKVHQKSDKKRKKKYETFKMSEKTDKKESERKKGEKEKKYLKSPNKI